MRTKIVNMAFATCFIFTSCKGVNNPDQKKYFMSMDGIWNIESNKNQRIMIRGRTEKAIVVTWSYSEECMLIADSIENVYSSKNDQCPNETSYKLNKFSNELGRLDLPFNTSESIQHVTGDTAIESFLNWYVKYQAYSVWGSNTLLPVGSIVSAFENNQANWTLIGAATGNQSFIMEEFKYIAITFSGGTKWEIDKVSIGDFTPVNVSSSNLGSCTPTIALKEKDDGNVCTIKNSGYLAFENKNPGFKNIAVNLK